MLYTLAWKLPFNIQTTIETKTMQGSQPAYRKYAGIHEEPRVSRENDLGSPHHVLVERKNNNLICTHFTIERKGVRI